MSNKGFLTVIVIVLVGIFALMLVQYNQETPAESMMSTASQAVQDVGDQVQEAGEEINDEIDDHTTAQ